MELNEYRMEELISDISMGPFGSNIKAECYTASGVPYLNGRNVSKFELVEDEFHYVTEEKADSLGRAVAARGDIIVTHRGTIGQIAYIPMTSKFPRYLTGNSQFRFTCNSRVLPEYIVYYFHTPIGRHELLSNASRVGVPALARPTTSFQKLRVYLPRLDDQRRIVEIIGSIEQKIVNNDEINDNLLQQAMTLFVHTFIEDPPCGESRPLYDFADYINGAAFKQNDYSESGLPIIKIAELKNGITDSTQFFAGDKGDKYLIHDKDILFSWSGNPDTSIDIFIWASGDAILNQHTFNVKSKEGFRWFVYLMLKYFKPQFTQIASNKQTTGLGHVTATDLKRLTFIYDRDEIASFEAMIEPTMEKIFSNMLENRCLISLRNSLLPRLMSGEIDVSDVSI